jgi:predicted ATP-grasp superfamily ATP-dependent carboligase
MCLSWKGYQCKASQIPRDLRSYSQIAKSIITSITDLDELSGEVTQKKRTTNQDTGNEDVFGYQNVSPNLGPTYIGGVSGGLLSICISSNIPRAAILVPSLSGVPDPEGAAILLETLARITHYDELKIDVKQLRQQGNQVRKNLEKIGNSIRNQQKSMSDSEAGEGRENLMYG